MDRITYNLNGKTVFKKESTEKDNYSNDHCPFALTIALRLQ